MDLNKRSSMNHDRATTYVHQEKLPKLPIPDLDSTLEMFVRFTEPLLSAEEQAETKKATEKFKAGDGPKLQEALREYSENKASYVEEFWSDAYLVPATSPVLNLNPFFLLEDGPDQKTATSQVMDILAKRISYPEDAGDDATTRLVASLLIYSFDYPSLAHLFESRRLTGFARCRWAARALSSFPR